VARDDDCVLWVVANPAHVSVNHFGVGDLVTVLGELQYHYDDTQSHDYSRNDAPPRSEAVLQVSAKLQALDKKEYAYVHARILQNANGTNVQLFMDGLKARRKLLLQAAAAAASSSSRRTEIGSTSTPLFSRRQGCGPPPYE
jgi:hypothetical protein